MMDHVCICVSDYDRSRNFYIRSLEPLGYRLLNEVNRYAGFGPPDFKPGFWISEGAISPQVHFCFRAKARTAVDAFYNAALAAGAQDNGPPGIRHIYHPSYYAAFVFDPDRYNIEAVCLD